MWLFGNQNKFPSRKQYITSIQWSLAGVGPRKNYAIVVDSIILTYAPG